MKQAYFFSHDSNAKSDPKILALIKQYGIEGYGRFWIIIETMSEQDNYKLSCEEWIMDALAMAMLCETNSIKTFVNDCIERYKLFTSDGEYFWSNSLIKRMQIKEAKRLQKVEAGKKGAETRWSNNGDIATPKQNDGNAIAEHGKGKERKGKETKLLYGEFTRLTPTEYTKLCDRFGKQVTDSKIESLDNWLPQGNNAKKRTDHYRTVLEWLKKDTKKTEETDWSERYTGPVVVTGRVKELEPGYEKL